jgi:hypothetical protein
LRGPAQAIQASRVAISYHTATESSAVEVLIEELARHRVVGQKLDYLTLSGFSLPDGPGGGKLRKDGWINHFVDILEGSIGMIVIQSQSSRDSETSAGRGMWVERQLAGQLRGALEEFVRPIDGPPESDGTTASSVASWVAERMPDLKAWLRRRQETGALPKFSRFDPEDVNVRQPFWNHELQFAFAGSTWFFISVLDLYDRVWHCRSCLATSDVWLSVESRPPAACPACGYSFTP